MCKSFQCFRAFRFSFASKEKGKLTNYKTKKKTIFEILSLYLKRFGLVFGSNLSSGAQKLPFYAQHHTTETGIATFYRFHGRSLALHFGLV